MGQYYTPVIKRDCELIQFDAHEYGNGYKLMEHSYVGNSFVNAVANNLVNNKGQLLWLGDYAGPNDMENTELFEEVMKFVGEPHSSSVKPTSSNIVFDWSKDWYFINHSKKEYFLLPKEHHDIWYYSPISLLTAIGNGRGGGDYRNWSEMSMVGYWAGDVVEICEDGPEDYSFIGLDVNFGFEEGW